MSLRKHAAAALAAVKANAPQSMDDPPVRKAYDVDEVPGDPDYPYTVVYVDQGVGAQRRHNGGTAAHQWRIVTSYFGTTADEARGAAELAHAALEDRRLSVAGFVTTPCRVESTRPVAPDPDGRDDNGNPVYSGSTSWAFGSSPSAA